MNINGEIMTRPTLEEILMSFALRLRERSTCLRVGHGCVITSKDMQRIYAYGYNGNAKGEGPTCTDEVGACGCVHAEMNALAKVGVNDPTKIVFITGEPCSLCARLIINSGASKVIYFAKHIRDTGGFDILETAGIIAEQVRPIGWTN